MQWALACLPEPPVHSWVIKEKEFVQRKGREFCRFFRIKVNFRFASRDAQSTL